MQMQNEALNELQRMSQLLALVAIKGLDEGEAVQTLARAGYSHSEIGKLTGLTKNAVNLRLIRMRRGKAGRNGKRAVKDGR